MPLTIETVLLESLTPDPKNVRLHPENNLDAIARSLAAFGQLKPIVVGRDGVIVAGNGTWEAARRLGWKEVQAVRVDLTPEQARAFSVADNRTSELAAWDFSGLGELLHEVQLADGELLGVVGWSAEEIEGFMGIVPDFQPVSIDEQGRLDQKSPIKCPHCGEEFVPK